MRIAALFLLQREFETTKVTLGGAIRWNAECSTLLVWRVTSGTNTAVVWVGTLNELCFPKFAACLPWILRGQAHEHTSFGWMAWQSHSSMADNRVVGLFRGVCRGGEVRVEDSRNAR